MLSVCIITKNERDNLIKCLEALSKYPVEIVVTDTGSSDDSVEVAKKYTENVSFFEWCDDFAAAKNFAASQAKNDLVLTIDTDEYVTDFDVAKIEKTMEQNIDKVGRIKRVSPYMQGGETLVSVEQISRVYDRRFFEYQGRIHEQIVQKNGDNHKVIDVPCTIDHSGYMISEEEQMRKADRNIALLLKELEDKPDDVYYLYQLGKGYIYKNDKASACEAFEKTFETDLDERLYWVSDMIVNYGYALLDCDRKEDALGLEGLAENFKNDADYNFMMGYALMQNAMFDAAVSFFTKATKCTKCDVEGNNTYRPYYNIGVIYECLGRTAEAKVVYKKCGDYDKAKAGLERLR